MHQEILFPREKAELYPLLAQQIAALAEDSQPLSTLANVSALLYEALPDINWVGFYLARQRRYAASWPISRQDRLHADSVRPRRMRHSGGNATGAGGAGCAAFSGAYRL